MNANWAILLTLMAFGLGLPPAPFGVRNARAQESPETAPVDPLRNAVMDSQKKLGTLSPVEKRIFDEEVVTQYQRFIRDYRSNGPGAGIVAEVDTNNIRNYLRFAAPANAKAQDVQVLTYLRPDPACTKCKDELNGIKKLVKTRFERRGMIPLWVAAEEVGGPEAEGKIVDSTVIDLAHKRSAYGAAVIQWKIAPVDAIDTAHADEKHYLIHSTLQLREVGRSEGQLELQARDSFEVSAGQLLTDAFTEMGARAGKSPTRLATEGASEMVVEVKGVKDYGHYSQIKQALSETLKEVAGVEERKMGKGRAVFAILTDKSAADLKGKVAAAQKLVQPAVEMEIH